MFSSQSYILPHKISYWTFPLSLSLERFHKIKIICSLNVWKNSPDIVPGIFFIRSFYKISLMVTELLTSLSIQFWNSAFQQFVYVTFPVCWLQGVYNILMWLLNLHIICPFVALFIPDIIICASLTSFIFDQSHHRLIFSDFQVWLFPLSFYLSNVYS